MSYQLGGRVSTVKLVSCRFDCQNERIQKRYLLPPCFALRIHGSICGGLDHKVIPWLGHNGSNAVDKCHLLWEVTITGTLTFNVMRKPTFLCNVKNMLETWNHLWGLPRVSAMSKAV